MTPRFPVFPLLAVLAGFTALSAGAGTPATVSSVPTRQAAAEILSESVLLHQPERYIGWPTIVRAKNGDLLVSFSGDRDWHVCPLGKVQLLRSTDEGKTWNGPQTVFDSPIDDRDAGLVVMADGTLILSTFSAVSFDNPKVERYKKYQPHAATISKEVRDQWVGNWVFQSSDHGKTWGPPRRTPVSTPHGPTVLADGRLLLVRPLVCESTDQGTTWKQVVEIQKNEQTWKSRYAFLSEQHAVQAADGRIIALSRYADKGDIEVRQMESSDGGRTWTEPRKTGMQGYPTHVLRLANDWLLATYGRRIPPMGQRACISKDNGKTWLTDEEIVLSNAVHQGAGDLGYPSSAQLPDGSIWSVYYQVAKESDGEFPSLMATHWRLNALK